MTPATSAPAVHSASLPHKLRHKQAKHAVPENEPPNHRTECSSLSSRHSPLPHVDPANDGSNVLLKQESDTLRSELHRLAGEVASLKTLLAPGPYTEIRKRAESFVSNSSDHHDPEEMDSDDTKDLTAAEDEHTAKSSCDSGPEESHH